MRPEQPSRNACLFLDVDGTLIDIAPTPDAVVVPDGLVDDLMRVERALGGALALVSGRTIADLDALFAPLKLKGSGVHGSEFRFDDGAAPLWTKSTRLPATGWHDLTTLLQSFPRTLAEDKGFSYAVHYRAAPELGRGLHEALERFLAQRVELDLAILPGHYVYELKRPDINKGAAIEDFMQRSPFAGRQPVFVGDDVTDMPGFDMVKSLGGQAYSVRAAFPGVTGTFADPAAVRHWLSRIEHSETGTV